MYIVHNGPYGCISPTYPIAYGPLPWYRSTAESSAHRMGVATMPVLEVIRDVWRWFWNDGPETGRAFDWLHDCIWCWGKLPMDRPAIPLVSASGQLVPEQACSRECAGAFYRDRHDTSTFQAERRAAGQRFYADWLASAVDADQRQNGARHA